MSCYLFSYTPVFPSKMLPFSPSPHLITKKEETDPKKEETDQQTKSLKPETDLKKEETD